MAFFAYMSVNPNYVLPGQRVNVTCIMVNTGSSNLSVNTLQPTTGNGTASAARNYPFPIGSSNVVPAGGQLAVSWSDAYGVSLQPSTLETQVTVGALIQTSDSVYTAATPSVVNVALPATVPPTQPGTQPYTPSAGPLASVTAAAPLPGATPYAPLVGQFRFDSQVNAALVAALGL